MGKTWDVRKVYMRGSGITMARILADPPFGAESKERGRRTVDLIRQALTGQSQIKKLADGVEGAAGRDQTGAPKTEAEEQNAWEAAEKRKKDLEDFGRGLCRHADNVMSQTLIGDAAKLWSLRNIFALDLAAHTLRKAWERLGKPEGERCIVMSVGGPPRANNPVRCESEESYQRARVTIREAIILALADEMGIIAQGSENPDWEDQFEARSNLDEVCTALAGMGRDEDFRDLARQAFDCANYDRAGDGFRVLLESIGLLQGTGQWRYFGATPELLAAMVGALSEQMPMSSRDFFRAIHSEWGIVVSPETAQGTPLLDALDGADLARNARRLEAMLAESGLAVAMSDSTTVVGERSRRIH